MQLSFGEPVFYVFELQLLVSFAVTFCVLALRLSHKNETTNIQSLVIR